MSHGTSCKISAEFTKTSTSYTVERVQPLLYWDVCGPRKHLQSRSGHAVGTNPIYKLLSENILCVCVCVCVCVRARTRVRACV